MKLDVPFLIKHLFIYLLRLENIYFIFICLHVPAFHTICVQELQRPEEDMGSPGAEVTAVVCYWMWVLPPQFRSSGRAECAPDLAISLALILLFFVWFTFEADSYISQGLVSNWLYSP